MAIEFDVTKQQASYGSIRDQAAELCPPGIQALAAIAAELEPITGVE